MIVVHSKSDCPYCEKAKAWLTENGILFHNDVLDDYHDRQAMYDALGLVGSERTVPQILVPEADGSTTHIRGYEGLINSGLDWKIGFS